MKNNEKAARIIDRLREIEILSEPRPYKAQLDIWAAEDTWSEEIKSEVSELIAMLNSLITEVQDGTESD